MNMTTENLQICKYSRHDGCSIWTTNMMVVPSGVDGTTIILVVPSGVVPSNYLELCVNTIPSWNNIELNYVSIAHYLILQQLLNKKS